MKAKTIFKANHTKEKPYLCVDREIAQNRDLSFAARGMLAYILSKPSDWEINLTDLQQGIGRDQARKILNELIQAGHIVRVKQAREKGRFVGSVFHCYELPLTEKPSTVEPTTGKPTTVSQDTVDYDDDPYISMDVDESPFTEKPTTVSPTTVKPTQQNKELNKEKKNKNKVKKDLSAPADEGKNKQTNELKEFVAREFFGFRDVASVTEGNWKLISKCLAQILRVHDANGTTCTEQHLAGFLGHYRKHNQDASLPLNGRMEFHYARYYADKKAEREQKAVKVLDKSWFDMVRAATPEEVEAIKKRRVTL